MLKSVGKHKTNFMQERGNGVNAYIYRDASGVCRVFVQRAKYKHWFELGCHAETDAAFEDALSAGCVCWGKKIIDPSKLF